jgi:hypothetical protein
VRCGIQSGKDGECTRKFFWRFYTGTRGFRQCTPILKSSENTGNDAPQHYNIKYLTHCLCNHQIKWQQYICGTLRRKKIIPDGVISYTEIYVCPDIISAGNGRNPNTIGDKQWFFFAETCVFSAFFTENPFLVQWLGGISQKKIPILQHKTSIYNSLFTESKNIIFWHTYSSFCTVNW